MARSSDSDGWDSPSREERKRLEASGRVPPADLEAEKAVLSSVMIDNEAFHVVFDHLKADDFYHPAHQLLFQAMVTLRDSSQPVDLLSLIHI